MTHHTSLPRPLLSRRNLLLLAGSSLALAACGGGDDDDVAAPVAQSRTAIAAAAAVAAGLVGVALGRVGPDAVETAVAGVRRLGGRDPVRADDLFAIGSNTKAMSSAAIGALVQRGDLAWSTRLIDVLPDLATDVHPAYAAITLDQLLGHTAGLPPFNGSGDDEVRFLTYLAANGIDTPATLAARRQRFARWLVTQAPPDGVTPGTTYLYSNAGYAVAAAMVEARLQRDFEAVFDELLVKPLGLTGVWRMPSEVEAPQPLGHEGPRADLKPFVPDDESRAAEVWLQVLQPAGYWACSAASYGTWLRWNLQALKGQATPLAPAYVDRIRTAKADTYLLGWQCLDGAGSILLAHSGHVPGFMAEAVVTQAGDRAVLGLTNTGHFSADGSSWVLAAVDRQLGVIVA